MFESAPVFTPIKAFQPDSAGFWPYCEFSKASRLIKAKFLPGGI
jgi:hypothetical protein